MNKLIVSMLTGMLSMTATSQASGEPVPYPGDYRSWKHIKSMLIQPGHELETPFQGLHHVYANKQAVAGLKNNRFKDGAVLVFDLLNYTEKDKTIQEGARKLIGVMYRDEKKYFETGGWGFEGFRGNSKTDRLVTDGGLSCYGCHAPQKSNQYVFSKDRL